MFMPPISAFNKRHDTPLPLPDLSLDHTSWEEEEEEEEEEELRTPGIILRLGLFFDGTGNNRDNVAATAQCRRLDLKSCSASELANIKTTCSKYGFGDFDGTRFNSVPGTSYGGAPTNVVHLYELYPDHSKSPIDTRTPVAYLKAYVDGIGTRSGGQDSAVNGQLLGQGETGVLAKVKRAPDLIARQVETFRKHHPGTVIKGVEFDIFGFSRGAAAARHCANELLKPGHGAFRPMLQAGRFGPAAMTDVSMNLIALFDTVAAISDPAHGDFGPGNDINRGINLYLPPGCARKVIHLHARDEYRLNFPLNKVHASHQSIVLPGAHADIGGGYLPQTREQLWMTQPVRATVRDDETVQASQAWATAQAQAKRLRNSGIAQTGSVTVQSWRAAGGAGGASGSVSQDYWICVRMERQVRHELALIPLRVMRELGVRHGVPFAAIAETDPRFALPADLKPIAAHVLQQVTAGKPVTLSASQETLLRSQYIHQSAHWADTGPYYFSKPAPNNRRVTFEDRPQKGYPE
ncbi:DUF2235 domain-containing protein [Pseudomonas sp. NPDC088444]|uniref:DUF2235 domain-containing protein n=1 Tax=Pseudomonas sp. NPDC088444 TaxID=3364456 RepID=UPI00384DD8DB